MPAVKIKIEKTNPKAPPTKRSAPLAAAAAPTPARRRPVKTSSAQASLFTLDRLEENLAPAPPPAAQRKAAASPVLQKNVKTKSAQPPPPAKSPAKPAASSAKPKAAPSKLQATHGNAKTAKTNSRPKTPAAAPAAPRAVTDAVFERGALWKMSGKNVVAYVTDSALAADLLAIDPKKLAKSAMAVYCDKKGKAFAWQVRFDLDRWDELARRLG